MEDGTFASSVWLYQETGAAVALGKMPLVVVEMHEHYAGELQKNYQYIRVERPHFGGAVSEAVRRLNGDLTDNHILLPPSPIPVA
jgi:hypothetical protein